MFYIFLLYLRFWNNWETFCIQYKVCFYVLFSFAYEYLIVPTHVFEKTTFFSSELPLLLCQSSADCICVDLFLCSLFCSIWSLCMFHKCYAVMSTVLYSQSWKWVLGALQLCSSILCWLFLVLCMSTSIVESSSISTK